jgi:GntR family transcriptional regulator
VIAFRLDRRSGVPTYLQLVQQVENAVRLGILRPGDQLPTAKEVVGALAINPNTVLKAYRELDLAGLVETQRGRGTFVVAEQSGAEQNALDRLGAELDVWVDRARRDGLDDGEIRALLSAVLRAISDEAAA